MNEQNERVEFGHGEDLTGRAVNIFGELWIITRRNYLGDWTIVRHEIRDGLTIKITSSAPKYEMPEDHPYHAELVAITDNLKDGEG